MSKALALTTALVFGLSFSAKAGDYEKKEKKNIVEVATEAGMFTTLLKAAVAADLAETLSGEGPFTVLAPTDEAFAKLPEGALAGLLEKPEALKEVLLNHVISGKVLAADVVKLEEADSLHGDSLTIDTEDGVSIGGAKVVKTDVMASNGVIHVIDTVILPKAE
ncbi:MAG: fasciclin domain-containing protein [Candidatus Hydrogenedens sp.]|nr:fasciclin domain-containing protein [Candidatus Hydrogenedens sp.]